MLEHFTPVRQWPADGFVHGQERQVAVDLVPGDRIEILKHVARCKVMPRDVHRDRHAGGPLDERVGWGNHGHHRGQVRRLFDRGQPLVLGGIRPALGGDLAGRPILRAAPFDRIEAVTALVNVGHEGAAGITPATHVGDDENISPRGEIPTALQALLVARRFQIRCARMTGNRPRRRGDKRRLRASRRRASEFDGRTRPSLGGSVSKPWMMARLPGRLASTPPPAADTARIARNG